MKQASVIEGARELKKLRGRLERWRQHRDGGRCRVPEELWEAAAQVARVQGIHSTARALRFNYYDLKKRVARAQSLPVERPQEAFVELQIPAVGTRVGDGRLVVEFTGSRGGRMRMEVADLRGIDVVGLAQAFWSREP